MSVAQYYCTLKTHGCILQPVACICDTISCDNNLHNPPLQSSYSVPYEGLDLARIIDHKHLLNQQGKRQCRALVLEFLGLHWWSQAEMAGFGSGIFVTYNWESWFCSNLKTKLIVCRFSYMQRTDTLSFAAMVSVNLWTMITSCPLFTTRLRVDGPQATWPNAW